MGSCCTSREFDASTEPLPRSSSRHPREGLESTIDKREQQITPDVSIKSHMSVALLFLGHSMSVVQFIVVELGIWLLYSTIFCVFSLLKQVYSSAADDVKHVPIEFAKPRSTSDRFLDDLPGAADPSRENPEVFDEATEWEVMRTYCSSDLFQKLLLLRQAVDDCLHHSAPVGGSLAAQPATLLRFLEARNGNVSKAEKMFRSHLDWRQSFGIEEKLAAWRQELFHQNSVTAKIVKAYGSEAPLLALDGISAGFLWRISVLDMEGIAREIGVEAVTLHIVHLYEECLHNTRREMIKTKKYSGGRILILDLGDYGKYGQPRHAERLRGFFKFIFKVRDITLNQYPEVYRKTFVLRGGPLAMTGYRIMSKIMSQREISKFECHGWKASSWLLELRRQLPLGFHLPRFLECEDLVAFAAAEPRGGIVPQAVGRATTQ